MYPGTQAQQRPDQPAFIMAGTGDSVTYAEFEARTNRLAHLLRSHGLRRLDHYSIFMENHRRHLECCGAGERAGLYYTCVNSYLTPDEVAYILDNSASRALITSRAKLDIARAASSESAPLSRSNHARPRTRLMTAAANSRGASCGRLWPTIGMSRRS